MFTQRLVSVLDRFAAPHGFDRYAEQIAPTWSSTEVRARVVAVDRTTPDSVSLTLEPNRNWTGHRAGQHTQVTVEIDGVRQTRCYSITTSEHADDRRIGLTVKTHPDGLVSNHLAANATVGTIVGLSAARGDFTLPDDRPEHLLLISGGSGITPALAMLRTLCDEGHADPVTFVHYARSEAEHLHREAVDALAAQRPNVRLVRIYSDQPGAGDVDGPLDGAQLDAIDPSWRDGEAYVCGPAGLMDAVVDAYASAGAGERVHQEAFTLPAFVAEAGDVRGTITLGASGHQIDGDGRPLLDQVEDAGLHPDHGCRMGICHTCVRSLDCGTVRDVTTGELTVGDGSPVRICINAPVGDVTIDL